MIFRAPAGHHILSRTELEKMVDVIERGGHSYAVDYLNHCIEEVAFYDYIRKQVELKKMYKEDGDTFKTQSVENKIREQVRQRTERNKNLKDIFLNE